MRSGFVELIVKNRLADKSINIYKQSRKYQPLDSFKKYINSVLPRIQEAVQIQLLKKNLTKIQSPLVREELVASYLRRLFRLRLYEEQTIKNYKNPPQVKAEQIITFTDPTILKTINQHTSYDIGSYILFSNHDYKTVFKNKMFGIFAKQHKCTQKFSIMIRKQSIGITSVMKIIQNDQNINWTAFHNMKPQQRLQYINNQQNYPKLFQSLSNYIMDKVRPLKNKQNYMRIWGNSVICDTLVNSILQNVHNLPNVFLAADKAIQFTHSHQIDPSAADFTSRFKQLPTQPPTPVKKQMPYFARFHYTTPSCKSVFLGGLGGTGKSMILAYATMFAFKNNWIVINVPNVQKWTQDLTSEPVKMFNGLFVIDQHAVQWLDEFRTINNKNLDLAVNLDLYGKIDLTGTHEQQYEPVPNLYYPQRQTYFNDIDAQYNERTQIQIDTRPKWRLTDILPHPKNIQEIIDAGIKNPVYSTCAMGELLRQIYNSEKLVLQVVDDFSWLYRKTVYRNYKYYNDNDLFGSIPPYHLAHCRFFVNLDGNKIRRGIKVVASSIGNLYKHHFDIKKIMLPKEYEHRVPNLTIPQFLKAVRYNVLTQYWQADQNLRKNPMYMYTLCQGNWGDFIKVAQIGHYY